MNACGSCARWTPERLQPFGPLANGRHVAWRARRSLHSQRKPRVAIGLLLARWCADAVASMPIGRQHRCQRDGSAATQVPLPRSRWRKRGHGVDQVLHLAVKQQFAICGLELFYVVSAAQVPVADRERIGLANDGDIQIMARLGRPELLRGNAGAQAGYVGIAR
jgi:hypothetical protein